MAQHRTTPHAAPLAHRLFIAVYPPPELARMMLAALPGLDLPPHRDVPVEQVHLTMLFLGDRRAAEVPAVVESIDRAAAGAKPAPVEVDAIETFPRPGPARLVAALLTVPPTIIQLQRRLVQRLANEPARHSRFAPHMTLARFRVPQPGLVISASLDGDRQGRTFELGELALVASILRPSGAEHRIMHRRAL